MIKYKNNKANKYQRLLNLPAAALQCPLVLLTLSVTLCLLLNFQTVRGNKEHHQHCCLELSSSFQPNPDLDTLGILHMLKNEDHGKHLFPFLMLHVEGFIPAKPALVSHPYFPRDSSLLLLFVHTVNFARVGADVGKPANNSSSSTGKVSMSVSIKSIGPWVSTTFSNITIICS